MASKTYNILFEIAGKVQSSFGSSFASAQKQLNTANNSIKKMPKVANSASNSFIGMGGNVKSLALKIGGLIGVGAGLKTMFEAAANSQKNLAQMDAVLKSTGSAAGMSKQALLQLADAQSKVTTFSKGTTIAGENLLLTFTGIGKDTFPTAIKAAQDMSTAMGTDLNSAVMTLGKALNDPATGLAKLTKRGVTFTAQQQNQIKTMVAAGNTAGAQAVMLKELQKEFGGSAEAAGKTFGGQLTILKNQLNSTGGSIASAVLPYATKFISLINNNIPKIQKSIGYLVGGISSGINKIGSIIAPFFSNIAKGKTIAYSFYDAFKNVFGDGIAGVITDFIGYFEFGIKGLIAFIKGDTKKAGNLFYAMFPDEAKTQGKVNTILKVLTSVKNFISSYITTIKGYWKSVGNTMVSIFKSVGPKIGVMIKSIGDSFTKLLPSILKIVQAFFKFQTAVLPTVKKVISFIVNNVLPPLVKLFNYIATNIIPKLAKVFQTYMPQIAAFINNLWIIAEPILKILIAVIEVVATKVISNVVGVFRIISPIIKGIWNILSGLIEFIAGVFSGNWSKAWEGVTKIFSGIFGTLGGLVKAPINAIINIINGAIAGINKINFKVPDWVPGLGGKKFGIDIPKIPMLANGGYIKHRAGGILANIGEGSEDEIVSPISKLKEIIKNNFVQQPSIVYSPQIIIQGSASKDDVVNALSINKAQFKRFLDEYFNNNKRLSFDQN